MISSQYAGNFRSALLRWYRRHGRDLPWRQTREPYAILVSEVMLQQTQVATVIPYYIEWLRRFPDLAALAAASESDVLHAWQGLGYYARARNLRAAAKAVQDRHGGKFPREPDAMRDLPGVGRYTANAVATFAFDRPVPIVEANTTRVLTRLFNFRAPIDSNAGREALWQRAATLVPKSSARVYNSALTDIGALICLPRRPRCDICPVRKFCRAKNPGTLPIKKMRPRTRRLSESHALVVRKGKILLEQSCGRWRGMWILPPLRQRAATTFTQARRGNLPDGGDKLDRFKRSSLSRRQVYSLIFPFTHHRVTLRVFRQAPCKIDNERQRWFPIRVLDSIPLPSPHRRALAALL